MNDLTQENVLDFEAGEAFANASKPRVKRRVSIFQLFRKPKELLFGELEDR